MLCFFVGPLQLIFKVIYFGDEIPYYLFHKLLDAFHLLGRQLQMLLQNGVVV